MLRELAAMALGFMRDKLQSARVTDDALVEGLGVQPRVRCLGCALCGVLRVAVSVAASAVVGRTLRRCYIKSVPALACHRPSAGLQPLLWETTQVWLYVADRQGVDQGNPCPGGCVFAAS